MMRGERPGGPCAIGGCPERATVKLLWAARSRVAAEELWYCERDAHAALERGRRHGRDVRVVERLGPDEGG
jgi:hypothetical protein